MKGFLFAGFLFLMPLNANALPESQANLKKLEKEKGFEEAAYDKNTKEKIKFFNLGQKNEWSKILDNKIAKEIEIKFGDEMKKLNYL